jgi:hypothetical protein
MTHKRTRENILKKKTIIQKRRRMDINYNNAMTELHNIQRTVHRAKVAATRASDLSIPCIPYKLSKITVNNAIKAVFEVSKSVDTQMFLQTYALDAYATDTNVRKTCGLLLRTKPFTVAPAIMGSIDPDALQDKFNTAIKSYKRKLKLAPPLPTSICMVNLTRDPENNMVDKALRPETKCLLNIVGHHYIDDTIKEQRAFLLLNPTLLSTHINPDHISESVIRFVREKIEDQDGLAYKAFVLLGGFPEHNRLMDQDYKKWQMIDRIRAEKYKIAGIYHTYGLIGNIYIGTARYGIRGWQRKKKRIIASGIIRKVSVAGVMLDVIPSPDLPTAHGIVLNTLIGEGDHPRRFFIPAGGTSMVLSRPQGSTKIYDSMIYPRDFIPEKISEPMQYRFNTRLSLKLPSGRRVVITEECIRTTLGSIATNIVLQYVQGEG